MNRQLKTYLRAAVFAVLTHLTAHGAGSVISTSFRDTTAPGWIFGGSGAFTNGGVAGTNTALLTAAAGIDTPGNGWLRLTDTNTYLAGYALYTNAIPSTNSSIFVSLDMAIWSRYGGSSADGFVLFFYDASVPFKLGASGGSLGYAQKTGVAGMGGGYLGLGVDEFGNYSNPNEGRIGGPGAIGNAIAVRGPGSGVSGYRYIAGTGDGITPRLATRFFFPNDVIRPTASTNAQHLEVLLSPNNQLTVYLRQGANAQFLCFVADLSTYTRPSNLKLGFTAGTGGNAAFHELQNVFINATVGIPWDNGSGDSLWGTAGNWHPDGVPVAGSEIGFDNTYVHSDQTIDLGGTTRTVRGLSFDADFPYTLTNGTLSFSTAAEPAGQLAISRSGVNGTAPATIAANIQISNDLTVDNAALGLLNLNGNLDNQGHAVYFAGMGAITVNGVISGAGQVVNYRSILTLTNNTYTGGTLLQNGTTILGSDQALSTGSVAFTGGTLLATNGTRVITNSFSLQGTALAIGGATPLTFTGPWSQTNLSSSLTINNTALTRFSGGIVLAENNQSRTLTLDVATTALVDSVITNGPGSLPDGLTKAGLGTLTLSASNLYSGLTTVSAGTLALGASERLRDSSTLMLAGGTLGLAGYTESVSSLGYTNGAIDFGAVAVANYIMFTTNLSAAGSLVILNFQAGVDHIAFRDTNTVSDAFVNGVYFSGYGVGATVTAAGQTIPGYSGTWKFIEPAAGQSTWDGGSALNNNWSTPTNWMGDVQPSSGSGVNVAFEGTTRLAPDLDSSRTVGQLHFNASAGAFTLVSASGSTLTLDGTTPGISQPSAQNEAIGHGLALVTNTIFDTLGAGKLIVSGGISGAGGIVKYSSGELSLTASNSYTGTNIFYNGLVNIQNGNALGATNLGTRVVGTATLEIEGNINIGVEPLSLNSQGFNNEGAICNESGANSYAGPITLEGSSRINTDGGSLTVIGTISNNLAGVWDLTVGGNGNVILSNVVATGSGALIKDGSGTLTLKGASANTFSGATTVSGGLLELGKSAGVIAVGGNLQIGDGAGSDIVRLLARDQISDAANITLASSGLLDLNGFNETIANLNTASTLAAVNLGAGTLTVSGFDNSIFAGVISGSGAMVKANAGTLILTGPNTYTGATTVNAGVLRIEHNTALGAVTLAATVATGAALELKDGIAVGAKPLNLTGSGIDGTGGGALRNIAGDNSWAGNISLKGAAAINSEAGTLSLSGVISGAYALTKTGVGTLTLSGLNTYSGGTTNSAGTLSIAASSALGLESNVLTIGGGAVLKVTDSFNTSRSTVLGGAGDGVGGTLEVDSGMTLDYTSSSVISGTGSLIKTGAGTLSLGGVDTYTGGTYIKAGTLVSTSGRAPGPQPPAGSNLYAHHIYDGATLQIAVGSWSTERQVELVGDQVGAGGAAKIDIINGFTQQRNGLIYGAGKLDLVGTGTLIVTGPNTYSGGTIIEHGVLQANNSTGSATGTGAVTVKNGGTLSGLPTAQGAYAGITGSASGVVEIQSTGKLLARSGGTLALGGLTLDAGAFSTFQLGAPTASPLVNITAANAFALPGASTIEIVNAGALGVGTYHLFHYAGTGLADISHLTLASSHSGSFNLALVNNTANTSIDLEVTAITDQWKKGGVDTYWSTAGNWWGTQPNSTGAGAQFINNNGDTGFGTAETATLDASKTVGSIAFNNTGTAFTIAAASSQTLTLDQTSGNAVIQVFSAPGTASHVISAPVILADDLTVTIASGTHGLDISGAVSGTGKPLTKTDSGPLTLSGGAANTYSGLTEVGGGTLYLNKTPGINAISSGGLQIDFGTTAALLADNQVADSATVTVNGTFDLGTHSETLAALGGGGTVATGSGSVLTLGSATDSMFIGSISGAGGLAKAGTGSLTLNGTNTYTGGTAVNAGTLQVGADHNLGDSAGEVAFGSGTLFFSGSFTSGRNMLLNSGGGTFDTDGSGVTLTGVIRGAGTLTKTGTGTVKLSGANTYSGATTINNGILRIGNATSLGAAPEGTTINASGEIELEGSSLIINEPLTLNGGAVCNLGNVNTYGGPITLTANSEVDADDGTLIITSVISGASFGLTKSGPGMVELTGANTYTGPTTLSDGTLIVATIGNGGVAGNLGQAGKAAANLVFNGGTLRYTGASASTDRDFTINDGLAAIIEVAANTLTLSGASTATAGGLTKTGAGTLALSGPSAYSGETTIGSGALKVNNSTGSATGTNAVIVASGATLGGTGTAAGAVAVNGTVAPGDGGIGTLNTGAQSWNGGGTNLVEINNATGTAGTGWDSLNLSGTLTVSATSGSKFTIKLVSLSGSSSGPAANFNDAQNYTWLIASASGGVSGFDPDKFTLDDSSFANAKGDGHFSVTHSGNNVYLHFGHVTATPFSIGRAWGTFLRIPKADVLAKTSGGTGDRTLLSVTSRDQDFVQISGAYILFAPYGNTNSILDYTVEDSASPTRATASSTISVVITNAFSSVNSISNNVETGTVTIRFAGIPGYAYAVERSSDLANWETIWTTNTPAAGVWIFTDGPDPAPPNPSYYRLRQNNTLE